jgi:phage terminase small subunit
MATLTARRLVFVEEYLIDLNATQAAIRAGYSRKTARQQGDRLLTNVDIARAIQPAVDERKERTSIKADDVLKSIERLAIAAEAAGNWNAALRGQELLGKHLKLFTDMVKVDNGKSIADLLDKRIARVKAASSS